MPNTPSSPAPLSNHNVTTTWPGGTGAPYAPFPLAGGRRSRKTRRSNRKGGRRSNRRTRRH